MNKRFVDQKEFNGLVGKLCRDIANQKWRPDYIVGVTRGGLLPALMISHYFDIPMHTLSTGESNLWMAEDAFGHNVHDEMASSNGRKRILIVDDINDTGKTINSIMEDWKSGCYPSDPRWKEEIWNHNVKFAVVYDNVASKAKVTMDFCGEEIAKNKKEWIVFPYENWWG